MHNMPVLVVKGIELDGFVSTGLRFDLHQLRCPCWDVMKLAKHALKLCRADRKRSPHVVSAQQIDLLAMMEHEQKDMKRKRGMTCKQVRSKKPKSIISMHLA